MREWSDNLEDWEYPEPDDEPDQVDTISCPHCRAEIYEDAVSCPSCGTWLDAKDRLGRSWPRSITWAVLIVFALAMWLVLLR